MTSDGYACKIVGWRVYGSGHSSIITDALEQVVDDRKSVSGVARGQCHGKLIGARKA